MKQSDYEQIYRQLHPRSVKWSSVERQMELSDLWPVDQEKFKRSIDKIVEHFRSVN